MLLGCGGLSGIRDLGHCDGRALGLDARLGDHYGLDRGLGDDDGNDLRVGGCCLVLDATATVDDGVGEDEGAVGPGWP